VIYSLRKWHGFPVAVQWSASKRFVVGLPFMGRRRYVCSQPNTMRGRDGGEDKGGVRGN